MITLPREAAPRGVSNLQERTAHVQNVLNETSNWQEVTSLAGIETMASDLHRCRCGADLVNINARNAPHLTSLLQDVDTRVSQCWSRFAELQSSYLESSGSDHIDAESKQLIRDLLREDAGSQLEAPLAQNTRQVRRKLNPDVASTLSSAMTPSSKSSSKAPSTSDAQKTLAPTSAPISSPLVVNGLPNLGNTCYINTPLAALAMSTGVSKAVDDRIETLASQPRPTQETRSHLSVLTGLRTCINHINGTAPLGNRDIVRAINQLRRDMTDTLGYVDLTRNQQGDASNDFLLPLIANFLPNFCPEGSIVRSSTGPSESDPTQIETSTFNEVGLIQLPLAEARGADRIELQSLLTEHFEPRRNASADENRNTNVRELHLSDNAPDNLVVMLDRAMQQPGAAAEFDAAPEGFHPEQQIRNSADVGLPENGVVTIKGQDYRIETIGLHHSSGRANANIHERGGHFSCFVSDTNTNTLARGCHFNDSRVGDCREHAYHHNSLEKGVVFVTLKKLAAD